MIDIDSCDCLLTFPIFDKDEKEVKAIVQIPFLGEVEETKEEGIGK